MPKGVSAAEKKERVLKWFQTNKKVLLAPALKLPACAHRGRRGVVLGPEGC